MELLAVNDSDDDDGGAWAGDEIPVPEPPVVAPAAKSASARSLTSAPTGSKGGPDFETLAEPPGAPGEPTSTFWTRRNRAVVAVVVGVAVVAAVSIVRGGDDDSAATDTPVTTTDAPDDTLQRTSTTSEAPPPETTAPSGPMRVALPPEVAAINTPTEVLMLTTDGSLHTLSLPSGVIRSVPIDPESPEFYPGQSLVVAPDSAAFVAGDRIVIVPRDGPATSEIAVSDVSDLGGAGFDVGVWKVAPDGSTRFVVVTYANSGANTFYEVGLDGSIEVLEDSPDQSYATIRTPDGRTYVNDAGGIYEVESDGSARRIDDGVLRAVSPTSLLIRECTPELDCADVLVDRATGERRPIGDGILPDELQFSGFGLDMSPDGTAVTSIVNATGGQDLVVVDLTTGDQVSMPTQSWNRGTRWAGDSSGVFELSGGGTGIDFLDRATGQVVHFADELGQIAAVAVRTPAAELGPLAAVATVPITIEGDRGRDTGLVLSVLSRSGNITEVDVDARSADVWATSEAIAVRTPALFAVGDQLAVVTSQNPDDEPSGYLTVAGQQQALPPGVFGSGPILAGPIPGTVWTSLPAPLSMALGVEQVLVDLQTAVEAVPAQTIGVPGATLLGGDGRGGLVVQRGGDVYIATSAGEATELTRLTSGELLAIGIDTAYVRECDDSSRCDVVRVDRITGTRAAIPETSNLGLALAVDPSDPPFGLSGTAVAPGGGLAVVRSSLNDGQEWVAVDVTSGASSVIDAFDATAPLVWSNDATRAATLIGPDLVIVDTAGVSTVEGLGSMRALGAAPLPASTD